MSERLLPAVAGLATVALVVGCGQAGLWVWLPPAAIGGSLWLFGLWRRWRWASLAGFLVYTIAAALGSLLGAIAGWMLVGVGLALAAWDLDSSVRRMQSMQRVDAKDDLERHHLLRLLAVEAAGLPLAGVALGARLELGFGLVLLLGLLAVLGLSQAIGPLRRGSR
jgi:hypothetical protein